MGFDVVKPISEYCFTYDERHPDPAYRFTCTREREKTKKCRIFQVDSKKATLVFQIENVTDDEEIISFLHRNIFSTLDENGLISGGHTVINLADKYSCGQAAVHTTQLAMEFIKTLQFQYGKTYDFLLQFNDLYSEKDDSRKDKNKINPYRQMMRIPLIIPTKINSLVREYSASINREIAINYCFEKNMSGRCKRYLTTHIKNNENIIRERNDFFVRYNAETIQLTQNSKPNCAACHAAMLRYVRYNIAATEITDNLFSYIGIFPLCSETNVLNGCKAAYSLYPDFNLKTYIIFYEDLCY